MNLVEAMIEAFARRDAGRHNIGMPLDEWLERIAEIRPEGAPQSEVMNSLRLHHCGLAVVEVFGRRYITTQVHAEQFWNRLGAHAQGKLSSQ